MASVLLIDDEPKILRGLRLLLKPHFNVITTTEPEEDFRVLQSERVNVLVSDQRMPNMQGVEVLRKAKEVSPQTVRVLLTGYADLAAVVGAVNEGEVYRYLQKPWDNQSLLEQISDASRTSQHIKESFPREAALGKEQTDSTVHVYNHKPAIGGKESGRAPPQCRRSSPHAITMSIGSCAW